MLNDTVDNTNIAGCKDHQLVELKYTVVHGKVLLSLAGDRFEFFCGIIAFNVYAVCCVV